MALKYRRWHISEAPEGAAARLKESGFPSLLSAVLASRGISTAEEASVFLDQERDLAYSPMLMKDMDKAVRRIEQAIERGEQVAVFGDYDVDGITSTCVVVDYLKSRGLSCLHYIPRREEDGYGLGTEPIRSLSQQGVTLLITVDCGITGVEEIAFAATLGMDVVVTDHHECKEQLPAAAAVVDPHRPDCPYPFKHLAGVGVALKLVLALAGESREEAIFSRYCTLAAIGTIADVMLMSGENRAIVRRGLESLHHTDFLGIHALLKEAGLADRPCTSIQIGFVLAPRINAAGRMGAADVAVDLLLSQDEAEAEELARRLCALNRERQSVEQEIFSQALELTERMPEKHRHALVLSSSVWHQGVVGIVASRLTEKYSCPSFMIHLCDGLGKGSCRSYGGFNLFQALESCSELLEGFGGHELAAGFTIREENIAAFRERINQCALEFSGGEPPVSSLDIDVLISRPGEITMEEIQSLAMLEPYGAGNNRPVFCLMGMTVDSMQNVGQNRHLKLQLSKGQYRFPAIFFSVTEETVGVRAGMRVDAAFYLQINEFRGAASLQLQMLDIRPSRQPSKSEGEALALCRRALEGGALTSQETARLLFSREQSVRLWRALSAAVPAEGLTVSELPFSRDLAAAMGGRESFLRTVFALEVFRERGLLSRSPRGEEALFRLTAPAEKVDLMQSPYLRRLQEGGARSGGERS
ncbi:MAG: single-stranded-DNA-specific exonuclease RecJ [Oscillospiraceae bacterium]